MASTILILSALLTLISATPSELGPSGVVCVTDNVLRALQNPTRTKDSYPFCSSYIGHGPTSTKYLYTVGLSRLLVDFHCLTFFVVDYNHSPNCDQILWLFPNYHSYVLHEHARVL